MTSVSYWIVAGAILGFPVAVVSFLKACSLLDEHMPEQVVNLARRVLDRKVSTRLALYFFSIAFRLTLLHSRSTTSQILRECSILCFHIFCNFLSLDIRRRSVFVRGFGWFC